MNKMINAFFFSYLKNSFNETNDNIGAMKSILQLKLIASSI